MASMFPRSTVTVERPDGSTDAVEGVLFAPGEVSGMGEGGREGYRASASFHIPSAYGEPLAGCVIVHGGERWRVAAEPEAYPPDAVPHGWNRVAEGERAVYLLPDALELVAVGYVADENGAQRPVETPREVAACRLSVSASDAYSARAAGLRIASSWRVRAGDYRGEPFAVAGGRKLSVGGVTDELNGHVRIDLTERGGER